MFDIGSLILVAIYFVVKFILLHFERRRDNERVFQTTVDHHNGLAGSTEDVLQREQVRNGDRSR